MTLDLRGRRGRGPVKGPLSTEGQHSNWRWARERAASPAFWSLHCLDILSRRWLIGLDLEINPDLRFKMNVLKLQQQNQPVASPEAFRAFLLIFLGSHTLSAIWATPQSSGLGSGLGLEGL